MDFTTIPLFTTALALVTCWALLAVLCSLIHESFVQIKAERGRFMKKYLLQQLKDHPNDINWGNLLYMHGAVDLLSRAPEKPSNVISSRLFAETMISVVGQSAIAKSLLSNKKEEQGDSQATATTVETDTSYSEHLAQFKQAIEVLKPSDVISFMKQSLDSAESKAYLKKEEVYPLLLENMEFWFGEMMERLNLWYKKKTRERLFILGIVIGLVFNIDSIQLFSFFTANPESSKAMIHYYESHMDELAKTNALLRDTSTNTLSADEVKSEIKHISFQLDSLSKKLELPVGFQNNAFNAPFGEHPLLYLLYKLIGLLFTGFAASFGGPFWFDLLKKVYQK